MPENVGDGAVRDVVAELRVSDREIAPCEEPAARLRPVPDEPGVRDRDVALDVETAALAGLCADTTDVAVAEGDAVDRGLTGAHDPELRRADRALDRGTVAAEYRVVDAREA